MFHFYYISRYDDAEEGIDRDEEMPPSIFPTILMKRNDDDERILKVKNEDS